MAESEVTTAKKQYDSNANPYLFMSLFGIMSKQAASAAFASVGCFGNPICGVPSIRFLIGTAIAMTDKRCTVTAACTDLATTDILAHLRRLGWTPLLMGAADMAIYSCFQGLDSRILIWRRADPDKCGNADESMEIANA